MMKQILETLEYCGIPYEILDIGADSKIIISQHGGHVYGPFSDVFPEGLFWMPDSIWYPEVFRQELIEPRSWNTGGDRVWIAPEIQFNISDRNHYRETLNQPSIMDPGYYSMMRKGEHIHLHQMLKLPSYNTVTGEMYFDFRRIISKAENPLRKLRNAASYMDGISYCGYEQVLDLMAESDQDIFAESWDLLQIRPKGTLYIPMYAPLRGTDHYEPAGEHEILCDRGVCLRITGDSRYKIAYKSAVLTGRFGYLADSDTEDSYLLIINYPNNPSALYSEEPPLIPGDRGYSIHIYNDDGNSGGFAEMECNLQTIGRPAGLNHSIDRVTKWIFTGNKEKLKTIAELLLGWKQL
jgi:hypothetical protein